MVLAEGTCIAAAVLQAYLPNAVPGGWDGTIGWDGMGWDGTTGDDAAKRAGVLILHACAG